MAVTVDEVQSVQALLTTERAFFTEYSVKPSGDKGAVKFCLNLALLCDCLNIFGCANSSVATAMRLVYAGDGHPVKLLLEERGIVADCEIKTVGVDEESEPPKLGESNADVVAKVVCKPQCLREVFSDLDSSSEIVEIRVSHQKPNFW